MDAQAHLPTIERTQEHKDVEKTDMEKTAISLETPDSNSTAASPPDSDVIVDWNGPHDEANPLNWPVRKKWTNVILLAALTLLTPFASSMLAPSVAEIMTDFSESNALIGTLMVSVYLIGYAFGPLVLAPLSELYGRLMIYYISMTLFVLFNIACARSTNSSELIVFRVLTGTFGASPLTIGPGSIADMFRQEERGRIIAIWTLPILLGPSIGPIAGGYLGASLGWRWDFYFLDILTGVVLILCFILLKETHAPTILDKKTRRLRKSTGNSSLESALKSTTPPRELLITSIIRPTKMLCTDPIIFGLSVMTAIVYGTLYLLFTTIPAVFELQYGFSSETSGLVYLGLGVGQILGVMAFGAVSDAILRRMAKGGELKPEYRLPPVVVGTCFSVTGLIWYGWTAQLKVTYMVPIIGMGFIGAGVNTCFLPISTYLVDAYTPYAASATAANTVLRSVGGALLPLAGPKMYGALGYGWGTTLLAFITLANLPLVFFFIKKGAEIRSRTIQKAL